MSLCGVAAKLRASPRGVSSSTLPWNVQPSVVRTLPSRPKIITSADAEFVTIEVVDTGAGIPRDIQDRLFDPFFSASPTGDGTGLGLSICAGIVKAHEGFLEVDSRVGSGSTFRVRLPVESTRRAAASKPKPSAPSPTPARKRILVVDDEPMICEAVESILSDAHDVTSVHTGRAATEALSAERYDLVVCDLMMRDFGGPALHRWALDNAPAIAERMVFITGAGGHATLRDFVAQHRERLLEKPFDADDIRRILARTL